MKKVVYAIGIAILIGCQNFVDDQSGINSKIENFVRVKLYPKATIESIAFSRFLKEKDKKATYYWLDYTFSMKSNGQKEMLKYHFETDTLLNIMTYKDITRKLKN